MPLERGRHLSTASRSSSGDSSPEGWLPHEGHRRSAVPALIADAGDLAGWRYVEFFTANIRNPNTRRAYARACTSFFAWCDERGLTLTTIRPHDVATYIV
jgi:hypothetical protein